MIANYHTHTWRCHHAEGTEREYVEAAIQKGLDILGFSDHAPYNYPGGYKSGFKMLPGQLEDYVDTVLRLRHEYRGQIDIQLGLEAEYYPALWEDFLRMIEPYPIEYLLLGQHFTGNEYDSQAYCGYKNTDPEELHIYCRQCMEAVDTGRFLYFAHPDLFRFSGDKAAYEEEMTLLCRFCKQKDVPLEINLLGLRESRHYPSKHFWRIAAREGNKVILGSDAHRPDYVCSPYVNKKAVEFYKRCGGDIKNIIDTIDLA